MTATLTQVRDGIKTVLQTVDGLDTVYGYPPGSPSPPCAIVGWPELWDPEQFIGSTAWEAIVPIQVLVATGENPAADRNLGAFFDPSGGSSIVEAFDQDQTLGGTITGYAIVRNALNIGIAAFADQGVQYLAATFNIEVRTG